MSPPSFIISKALCLVLLHLGLFVMLGSCQFKISVVQNNITAAPVEFILYCNQTIPQLDQRYEDLIWAVGALAKAPSRSDLLLHNAGGLAGLSASVQVGDQTFYEGPVLAHEHSYWVLSVDENDIITLAPDEIPHNQPADGIQVQRVVASDDLIIALTRHEAWIEPGTGRPRFGPPLGLVSPFVDPEVVLPPVLTLTLTETTFPKGHPASTFIGQPVGLLPNNGVSVTFKVMPPAADGTIFEVVLERMLDWSGVGYRVSYRYATN